MTTLTERRIIAAFTHPHEEVLTRDLMIRAAVPTPRQINNIISQGYLKERTTCSGIANSFTLAGRQLHRAVVAGVDCGEKLPVRARLLMAFKEGEAISRREAFERANTSDDKEFRNMAETGLLHRSGEAYLISRDGLAQQQHDKAVRLEI